jgi:uncharacterized protein (TIGR03435 family)
MTLTLASAPAQDNPTPFRWETACVLSFDLLRIQREDRIIMKPPVWKEKTMRVAARVVCSILALNWLFAQDPRTEFEVASVKSAMQGASRTGVRGGPGTKSPTSWSAEGLPALNLITTAYHVPPQLVSGPSWLSTERFDIVARVPQGATREEFRVMLQSLLRQRFQLEVHAEKSETPVYELSVPKTGLKFKESEEPPLAPEAAATTAWTPPASTSAIPLNRSGCVAIPAGGPTMMTFDGCTAVRALKQPMDWLVGLMTATLGQPIVDSTGLKGKYDFVFSYRTQARAQAVVPPPAEGGAAIPIAPDPEKRGDLWDAVQEQLGLRLESRRMLLDSVVVDHMEKKPKEN